MSEAFDPMQALESFFAGEIEPEDAERLRAWIEDHPERFEEIVERAKIHSFLTMTGVRHVTENVLISALESRRQVSRATRRTSALGAKRRWLALAVSGAALAIALLVVVMLFMNKEQVATIVAADDVVWKSTPLQAGSPIEQGAIHIESGHLTVMLASTAEMNIRGAARLDVVDAKAVRLHRGVAQFHCPRKAHGFKVALPGNAEVIDLGTDFEVEVAADGMARVTVEKGRVQVRAPGEVAVVVTAGNQVALTAAGEQRIGAIALVNRANAWKHQLEQLSQDRRTFMLLPLDGNAKPLVPAALANVAGDPAPAVDRFGHADGALRFNGRDSFVVYPVEWPQGDFTLSAWVRTAESGDGGYIIAAESKEEQLASRRLRLIGEVVKADAFVHDLHRIFVSDVRARGGSGPISPNRWTHVVATFRRLAGKDARMTIYIDGQRADDNRYEYRAGDDPIASGITVGNSPLNPSPRRCFHGDLDDVLLRVGALSDDEVLALYESSRPDPHPPADENR